VATAAQATSIEERIALGAAPSSADEIDTAVALANVRAMKWALAHRSAFGADTAARVEEAATAFAATSYHGALVELVGAMHVYWPRGLLSPRVRAAIHLAIELDLLGSQELFLLLQPLLAVQERFDAYLLHAERRPLGARLRVAALGRAAALAAGYVGLAALLPGERGDELVRVMTLLYRDRDPVVGVRAAWAIGALAPHSERARAIVEAPREPGIGARRAMVASTARFVLGDLEEDAYTKDLRKGIGKSDVFVRATAIHALRLGLGVAPATTSAIVWQLIEGAAPEVLAAAAAFAAAIEDADEREAMLARVRAEGRADAAVRFWTGPRAPEVEALHQALVDVRRAVRESPRSSSETSASALGTARRAVDSLDDAVDHDDVDHALDVLLFDSPIVRDAAAASAASDAERVTRYVAWAKTIDRLRDRRVARAGADVAIAEQRERLRRLARVLDAHPRADALGARAPAAALHGACRATIALVLAQRRERDPSLDRPAALALAAAIQPLVESESIMPTDVVGALLAMESAALAKHLGAVAMSAALGTALRSAAVVREAVDAGAATATLEGAARALSDALVALGAAEPLSGAARALVAAIVLTPRAATAAVWLDALVQLDAAVRDAVARFDLPARPAIAIDKLERALRSRLAHAGLVVPAAGAPPFGAERAAREIDKALPPLFAGLVEAVVVAAKTPAKTSAAPTRRPAIRPGRRIGDYVVEKVLGSGGMGHCVLVRRRLEESQKNARRWVLKLPQGEEYTSAFRNEALALLFLSKANHPAIVRFVSYVDYGYRLPYLVMEHVEGDALDRRLLRGPIAPRDLYAIGAQLAEGIATSHKMQIAHHDIKPANVILAAGDRPVLVDWGLAGAAYPWAGTPEYMAPERFDLGRGRKTATGGPPNPPAADVFALGCVLAEMFSGRTLVSDPLGPHDFAGNDALRAKYEALDPSHRRDFACETIATTPAILARRFARELRGADPAFAALVERMLARRREMRPTATEVAAELRRLAKTP